MRQSLWTVLVPSSDETGKMYSRSFHKMWDDKVRAISGGLTILAPAKGQWSQGGQVLREAMIPVLLLATREEITRILTITLNHYATQAVIFAFKTSNEVILARRRL